MNSLPFYIPKGRAAFATGMQSHAPFIVTNHLQRSDLGTCIISTTPPHFVAKVRSFRTFPEYREGKPAFNAKAEATAQKHQADRDGYFYMRGQAEFLSEMAAERGCTIKELMENPPADYGDILPRTYDDEFDEPRVIAKVPGLNVYLELFGCLDDIDPAAVPWHGPDGAFATLKRMSLWAQNIWPLGDRRARATRASDAQPLPEWRQDYDPAERPVMPRKCGIGVWPYIDQSRRPELLFSKAPKHASPDVEAVLRIKAERAAQAAKGIVRE